jgi:hypothetical protein
MAANKKNCKKIRVAMYNIMYIDSVTSHGG